MQAPKMLPKPKSIVLLSLVGTSTYWIKLTAVRTAEQEDQFVRVSVEHNMCSALPAQLLP